MTSCCDSNKGSAYGAAAICAILLARVDWAAESQKAQDALHAAALTAAQSADAADEEAPDEGSTSQAHNNAQASTGEVHFCNCDLSWQSRFSSTRWLLRTHGMIMCRSAHLSSASAQV